MIKKALKVKALSVDMTRVGSRLIRSSQVQVNCDLFPRSLHRILTGICTVKSDLSVFMLSWPSQRSRCTAPPSLITCNFASSCDVQLTRNHPPIKSWSMALFLELHTELENLTDSLVRSCSDLALPASRRPLPVYVRIVTSEQFAWSCGGNGHKLG